MKKEYNDSTILSILYYLLHHNKNLTKQQEWALDDMAEKIKSLLGLLERARDEGSQAFNSLYDMDQDSDAIHSASECVDHIYEAEKTIQEHIPTK